MKRVLTALVFLSLVLGTLRWGPAWSVAALVAVIATAGILELDRMARRTGFPPQRWVAIALGAGSCVLFLEPAQAPERILALATASTLVILCLALIRPGPGALACAAATLFAGFYPGVLLSFLVGLRAAGDDMGRRLVFFLLLVIWTSDNGAVNRQHRHRQGLHDAR